MSYAIVYSSKTGNTRLLADAIREVAGDDCIYFGEPSDAALSADILYVGFWTDKGTCDSTVADFLKKLDGKKVFLFGTAGFGGSSPILNRFSGGSAPAFRALPMCPAAICAREKCRIASNYAMKK